MGRRNQGPPLAFDLSDTPPLPTAKRARLTGGRLISAHPTGGVWVYRRVPMEPMADARSRDALFASAAPLMTAYGEVANLSRTVGGRRGLSRSSYRETHLLWVNIPRFFHVTSEHSNAAYLNSAYHDTVVTQRLLLFGVRLVDSTNLRAGVGEMVRSLAEQWQTRSLPVSAFDADYATVDAALARAGLETPTSEEFRLADAWWNHGRAADTPILPHVDHLHVFEDASGLRLADQVGRSRCDSWPDVGVPATALTFASVSDFDLPFTDPAASAAMWACSLAVQGTAAVSVRGAVEPATATRSELRRNRKRYAEDIAERFKAGKMNKYEQDEHLANLQAVEELYATGGSPTLIDTSIVVAFDGQVADIEQLSRAVPGVELELLAKRQPNAWSEMLMTSSTRANPNLHDVPIQTIAHAGFQSLARVGDDPLTGTGTALLGFTENDRQPAWLGADAASLKDAYPLFIGAGGTGSGKLAPLSTPIPTPSGYTTMGELVEGDWVLGRDGRPCRVQHVWPINDTPDLFRVRFSDGQSVVCDRDHQWLVSSIKGRNVGRSGHRVAAISNWERQQRLVAELDSLADRTSGEMTLRELFGYVKSAIPEVSWESYQGVREALDMVSAPYRFEVRAVPQSREVTVHVPARERVANVEVRVYDAQVAVKALAVRLAQQHHTRPTSDADEMRMTVGEMLASGVTSGGGRSRFAVRVTEPLSLPEADLLVAPYTFGAWLGDGSSWGAQLHGIDDEVWDHIEADGFTVVHSKTNPQVHGVHGLKPLLRDLGVLGRKRIPVQYLRASYDQRLALLQGLMDTDGTVSSRGACELSLSDEDVARDALDLIRGLGIKASCSWGRAAGYRDSRGVLIECKPRHRIKFTTSQRVFRMARKVDRLPTQVRETQQWLYVTGIEPVLPSDADYEPGRCITVDSADRTYLIGDGYVPTSNTVLALSLAAQWARQGVPVVFVDPKTGSDHGPVVRAVGGQVASLDDLIEVDGVFDPIRFSARPIDGVQTAAAILSEINPWGGALGDTEQPLQVALAYGVNAGATCTGQALLLARDHGRASAEMVDKVLDYAAANPLFRAMVGVEPGNEGLRVTSKLTLIKVGNAHLDLPQPGGDPRSEPLSRRVVAALVRMMVHGAAMALTGRGGVVMLDEAWVFLGAGHSEVEKLGRLARSQRVLPMLFTQRVTDAVNAGLSGYISRGMILPLEEAEARAACQLFGLEPTAERIARITAPDTMGASGAPNWRSMKALYEGIGESRRLLRGTVGIYADLYNRVVPVEIKLPPDFLRLASTNAVDIARRDRAAGGEPPVGGGVQGADPGLGDEFF